MKEEEPPKDDVYRFPRRAASLAGKQLFRHLPLKNPEKLDPALSILFLLFE